MAYIFLEDGDLETAIISQFLNERSEEQPVVILEGIEKKRIATIKTKLNGRYDVDAIFEATADDRNYFIVDILIKLVLYDFIRRNAPRKVPTNYKDDYDAAMKSLEDIKAGKEVPAGLPAIKDTEGKEVGRIMIANTSKRNNYI